VSDTAATPAKIQAASGGRRSGRRGEAELDPSVFLAFAEENALVEREMTVCFDAEGVLTGVEPERGRRKPTHDRAVDGHSRSDEITAIGPDDDEDHARLGGLEVLCENAAARLDRRRTLGANAVLEARASLVEATALACDLGALVCLDTRRRLTGARARRHQHERGDHRGVRDEESNRSGAPADQKQPSLTCSIPFEST
jgi:hypothetical protein